MLPVFLCAIVFMTKGFLRKLIAAPLMQNGGVVSLKAPLRGIIHNSPVLTAGLYTHQGLNSFFQLHQTEDGVLFYSHWLLPLRIHVQLNVVLPQTVKPGRDRYERGPFSSEGGKQLCKIFLNMIISNQNI